MAEPNHSKEELIRSIRYAYVHHRVSLLAMFLLLPVLIGMAFLTGSFFLTMGTVIVLYVLIVLTLQKAWFRRFGNRNMELDEDWVADQILAISLPEHFQNVRFAEGEKIPEKVMKIPGFSFAEGCDTYWASGYAAAMCGVTRLELQNMAIGTMKTHWNSTEGNETATSYRYLDPHFRGMMYLCHLGTPFPPTTVHTGKKQPGEIRTGDGAFDRIFSVRTRDPRTMPLTPELRRFLTETAGKVGGRVYLHFASTGDVYLGFDRQIFRGRSGKGAEAFRQMDLQARTVTGLIRGLTTGF